MGKFSNILEEFQKSAGKDYEKLMDSLEEDHCWKCPMHSTSTQANCKEVHAWLKIQKALEEGVWEKIREGRSEEELEAIIARFLDKRFKKEKKLESEPLIILNVEDGLHPDIPANSALVIKPKAGVPVGVPFRVARVCKVHHQGPLWYLKTTENLNIPVSLVLGVVLKVLDKNSSICNFL